MPERRSKGDDAIYFEHDGPCKVAQLPVIARNPRGQSRFRFPWSEPGPDMFCLGGAKLGVQTE
jgi:hypothetical protein